METIQWLSLPGCVRKSLWSSKLLPKDFDYTLQIELIDVVPLYVALSASDPPGSVSDFESAGVYEDEVLAVCVEDDLCHPIIIDRRFNGLQANVASGLHRIMLAHCLGRQILPSIDVTDMFVCAGYPKATNKKGS